MTILKNIKIKYKFFSRTCLTDYERGFNNMKRKVWTKIFSMAAVILTSVSSTLNFVSAETLSSYSEIKTVEKNCANKFHVKNEEEFINCINKVQDGDTVILENGITLKNHVEIKTSMCLDLNGHNILVDNDKESIEKQGIIEIRKINLSNIDDIDKRTNFPAKHNMEAEKYCIKYDDNLKVTMKNGAIKRKNGENGKEGCVASYAPLRNGQNGCSPSSPVKLYCGTLTLSNIKIEGGNGGNGGNGLHGRMYFNPFKLISHLKILRELNVKGGNGGNGGDASCAVSYDKSCKIVKDEKTQLIKGIPGKGGKGGRFAFSYIIYSSGSRGEDGKNGKIQDEIFARPEYVL